MEEENYYDEFGNYIGPEINELNEELIQDLGSDEEGRIQDEDIGIPANKVVLYEDKKYYPDAEEIYPGAEIMLQEEDTQHLDQPLINTKKDPEFMFEEENLETTFDYEFLQDMMFQQQDIRNVSVVGDLHSGKSQFVQILVEQTHLKDWNQISENFFNDSRKDEFEKKISIKASPISLILPNSKGKSHLVNIMDTPGHPNFCDEICNSLRLSDGVVIMIDCIQGIQMLTEKLIKYCIQHGMSFIVIVSKIDRYILEMKIPPCDAYLKIKHLLEQVNQTISQYRYLNQKFADFFISPIKENVLFSSGKFGFVFSLKTFAKFYSDIYKMPQSLLCKVLFIEQKDGVISITTYKRESFKKNQQMIARKDHLLNLEGFRCIIFKKNFLSPLGIYLTKKEKQQNTPILVKIVCKKFFGNSSFFIDSILQNIPTPVIGSQYLLKKFYQGNKQNSIFQNLIECQPEGPLYVIITKQFSNKTGSQIYSFGKVVSGTLKKDDEVKILGQNYTLEDQEDSTIRTIKNLWIYQSRYKRKCDKIPSGNWCLIEGIDDFTINEGILTKQKYELENLTKIPQINQSIIKFAIEPLIPSELPKMLEGLRKIKKTYPQCFTKVEESGEHLLTGTGELYLDCVMRDLRNMFSKIEIKISDPYVVVNETVIDTSSIKCYADTSNKRNRMSLIAMPLEQKLGQEIEEGKFQTFFDPKIQSQYLQEKFRWDILESRSLWAFGPENISPNVLLNDTLPSETNQNLLQQIQSSMIHGFQWATKEGPLCEEPIRNVKYKILDAQISEIFIEHSAGQIIPAFRRLCYSSLLTANPRILEPLLICEVTCTQECLNSVYQIVTRRRGHIIKEQPIPGSPLYSVQVQVPAIDSFGLECDIRLSTLGQASILQMFDSWQLLPGDPLDSNIVLRPLEISQPQHLARELMIKTRRRKGLNEEVSIVKFFDDPEIIENLSQLIIQKNKFINDRSWNKHASSRRLNQISNFFLQKNKDQTFLQSIKYAIRILQRSLFLSYEQKRSTTNFSCSRR